MQDVHSFHIPVMGTSFTIDTPIKVAKYGISSVISLVDDTLIEQMRKFHSKEFNIEYAPIHKTDDDYRAKRITAYLNLVDIIVKKEFDAVKNAEFEPNSEISKYFELLDDSSPIKISYLEMLNEKNIDIKIEKQEDLRKKMKPGRIDVNIMTKLDRTNYKDNKELPQEFTDALAALRGYAKSTVESAIVFSAGLNRHLYSYVEKFEDFYANASGFIKKKIILKVTDYRSSLIQGKFFAKKGLWISEYRVESGLNCGGHAFPSKGFLIGPILDEFKKKKDELIDTLHDIYVKALAERNKPVYKSPLSTRITAQGGIGTSFENKLLLDHYNVDGTGWGTPFLLVPEAVNVDEGTLEKLLKATEKDLYLSDISPVGVPFNNLKNSFNEIKKQERIKKGVPGSPCPKGHLAFDTEFTEKPICVASRKYQQLKIEQLSSQNLSEEEYLKAVEKITVKACICHGLGAAALIKNNIEDSKNAFSAICPGPSIANFSKIFSLAEMIGHIYGRINLINKNVNHNLFIKDLQMTIDHFIKEVLRCTCKPSLKQIETLNEIKHNILEGIEYYKEFFPKILQETQGYKDKALEDLKNIIDMIEEFISGHTHIFKVSPLS